VPFVNPFSSTLLLSEDILQCQCQTTSKLAQTQSCDAQVPNLFWSWHPFHKK